MDVESGARTIVGVNKFQIEEKPVEGLLKVDASVGEKQKAKVEAMKAKRDNAAVEAALADLEAACKDENEILCLISSLPLKLMQLSEKSVA